ncbi:MAG TPA: matrixin family metalloprotease, partial [Thermoanaerobaculia bacterium]|nr:matrixin family metalloprotease [Thermoanaerobaculia bacterium]
MQQTMRLPALGLISFLVSGILSATSFVPVSDADLVDQAPVIAVAEVRDADTGSGYRVRVEKVLKGAMASGLQIRVRVPGRVRADGMALRIWGAPRLAPGERALLFLSPRPDGAYDLVHLMLGVFHEVRSGGHRLALRDLSETRAVAWPGQSLESEALRDFDRFVSWVGQRARGIRARADYRIRETPGLRAVAEEFTLTQDDDGYNLRWFRFDSFEGVEWNPHETGQQGLTGGGYAEFYSALQAWSNSPGTRTFYVAGDETSVTNGLATYDTVNSFLFNDPNGEVSPFVCGSGGVLAMGGPWYETATTLYQGTPYHRIVNADVVVNDGISCYFDTSPNPSKAAEEIFGHELGHTLGLGHSSVPEALMFPSAHNDGRGAALHNDDRAGEAVLYSLPLDAGWNLPLDFFTVAPCRLLDTRNPDGPTGGPA